MKKTQKLIISLGTVAGLGAGLHSGPHLLDMYASPIEYVGHGSEVEEATNVGEQARRADLIVRVLVVSLENRVLSAKLPMYAEDAKTILGYRESRTPFTDSTMEVLETFKGDSEPSIKVLQTGGRLDSQSQPAGRPQIFRVGSDPIFQVGQEHILFLVDISGDGVHSVDRPLYRVVNSLGRYEILGDRTLRGPGSYDESIDATILSQLPRTEDELLDDIAVAVPGPLFGKET